MPLLTPWPSQPQTCVLRPVAAAVQALSQAHSLAQVEGRGPLGREPPEEKGLGHAPTSRGQNFQATPRPSPALLPAASRSPAPVILQFGDPLREVGAGGLAGNKTDSPGPLSLHPG